MDKFKIKSLEYRIKEADSALLKYKNSVPVIVDTNVENIQKLDKNKYIVPKDITLGEFIVILRKKLVIKQYESIFLLINNTLMSSHLNMKEIYDSKKNEDGFLYIIYRFENTFG